MEKTDLHRKFLVAYNNENSTNLRPHDVNIQHNPNYVAWLEQYTLAILNRKIKEVDAIQNKVVIDDLQKLQNEIADWSDATFPPGKFRIATPMIHHLKKEVPELIEALDAFYKGNYTEEIYRKNLDAVYEEFADCLILLLDSAKHFQAGISTEELIKMSYAKLEINKAREWNEADENGVATHKK